MSHREIARLNQLELEKGLTDKGSWHDAYKDSSYIYAGNLPKELTEGDLLQVFSQYGEIVDLNLVRDKETGKSMGFSFIAFENQKSTVLTVDNLSGIKLLGNVINVDHVAKYRGDKIREGEEEEHKQKQLLKMMEIVPKHLRPKGLVPGDDDESSSGGGSEEDEEEDDDGKRSSSGQDLQSRIQQTLQQDEKLSKWRKEMTEMDKEDPMRALIEEKIDKRVKKVREKLVKELRRKEKKAAKKAKKKKQKTGSKRKHSD